jgi:Cdc6-like AAA superfamily ATPase
MNREDEKEQVTNYFNIAWILVSPLTYLLYEQAKRGFPNSKRVTKSRLKVKRFVIASALAILLSLLLYLAAFALIDISLRFAFVLIILTWLIHYPIAVIIRFPQWNSLIKEFDSGGLEPALRSELRAIKFQSEMEFAEVKYKEVSNIESDAPKPFGVRVFPTNSLFQIRGTPKVSQTELELVTDGTFGIFPLDSESAFHHIVVGQTGSGKTTLIVRMIQEALRSNFKVVLVDMKGDKRDINKFIDLADKGMAVHFPSSGFDFWKGSKEQIAERVISMIPPGSNPFYAMRDESAINAVVTRSDSPPPKSVADLLQRLRKPASFVSDPNDLRALTIKEKQVTVGDLIANDFSSYLEPFRMGERNDANQFDWESDWDLAMFSLDSFQPSWLRLGNVILDDFARFMLSDSRLEKNRPILLVVDEASALKKIESKVLVPLMQRARSAQVSLVLASQTISSLDDDFGPLLNSGCIRWIGQSSDVEAAIAPSGTKSVVEAGWQYVNGKSSGVTSRREQKEFVIDPDFVRRLPKFHWFVTAFGKVTHLYIPPQDIE